MLGGQSFDTAGSYERIVGRAFFAVDPNLPANKMIRDVDKAPRNENGLVEFSSDIYVLKPRDPAKGNGAVLYEVSNRGRKGNARYVYRGAPLGDQVIFEGDCCSSVICASCPVSIHLT